MQDQELKQLKLKLSAGINVWISLFHYLKEENVNWAQTAEQRESELESLQRRYDDLVLEKEKVEDELRKVKQQADEMEQLFLQRSQSEGNEEYEYLKRLKDLNVWNEQYEVSLVNAGGNGNIPARYQDRYQNGADELVLVFCDTEKKPHEQYEDIKRKINVFHGVDNAADEVIMFGNPCTMQIISKHWTDENLKSPAKPVNVPLIKKYTGVENYKGRADQINEVMKYVTVENYKDMSRRVKDLDSDDSVTGSSNFGKFIKLFESVDSGWIEEINNRIE